MTIRLDSRCRVALVTSDEATARDFEKLLRRVGAMLRAFEVFFEGVATLDEEVEPAILSAAMAPHIEGLTMKMLAHYQTPAQLEADRLTLTELLKMPRTDVSDELTVGDEIKVVDVRHTTGRFSDELRAVSERAVSQALTEIEKQIAAGATRPFKVIVEHGAQNGQRARLTLALSPPPSLSANGEARGH